MVASVEACDAKKSSQGPPRDHATVGLEAGLALEPIEVAIQLGHQGEREPYVDNGRRCAFRTAYRQLAVGLPPDGLLPPGQRPPGRDGFTVMLCPSIREAYYYNILQNISL